MFFYSFRALAGGSMHPRRTMERNREIYSRFKAGITVEGLAAQYGLTVQRIRAILIDEKHRQELSPEYFYRALRDA
jgi:Mor family transcriptional regulator